jgi:DNA-binding NarL/FixJ family response regulator
MVVEDDWLQAENLAALLARVGHEVCGLVKTGEQAVALAKTARPDAVFIDVKLAGDLTGIQAAEQITNAVSTCRVIFITAYSDPMTIARMRDLRPDAILFKPATEAEIEQAIAHAATQIGDGST